MALGSASAGCEVNTGTMLELGSCTDTMVLGSVSAVGDVTTGSVVGLCCSITVVLKSVSAIGIVHTGSMLELGSCTDVMALGSV